MEFLSRLVCDRRALERNLRFVYLASSGICIALEVNLHWYGVRLSYH